MTIYRGRLIDHLHISVRDLEASKRFYKAVIDALGSHIPIVEGPFFFYADELWVQQTEGQPSHVHFAFQVDGPEAVQAFYRAGLAAGGRDNGAPGPRNYHPGYYAAYLFDPDGNNIEAVFHGPGSRSADAVVIEPQVTAKD